MANSKGKGETLAAIEFEGGDQCFVLIMPVECMDCILRGVAAKPSGEVQPVKRRKRRTTGPMNKVQLSKRQLKKRQAE